MKKKLSVIYLIVVIIFAGGYLWAGGHIIKKDKKKFPFTFVQVTDTQIIAGNSVKNIVRGIEDINLLKPQPEFVVVTGDLVDRAKMRESFELYKKLFSQLECPQLILRP